MGEVSHKWSILVLIDLYQLTDGMVREMGIGKHFLIRILRKKYVFLIL